MWYYPAMLLVANIALCFTEGYSAPDALANVLLPGGIFLLLCAWSSHVGRTVLWCTPLSIFAAFQIVLLFLYGKSIIAVDMFLNVVTTNPGEVSELLGNLGSAILTVVVLYLPPIVWAIWLVCRKAHSTAAQRRPARLAGAVAALCGLVAMCAACIAETSYTPTRRLFPLNVAHNMVTAIERFHLVRAYPQTSAHFRFGAHSERPDSLLEVYVLVVGETCRADNWQLLGYPRPTNPRLSRRSDIVAFSKAVSESNTTHKSVPLMLSPLTAETFGDSIYSVRSIFEAFREAGYATAFFSNQQRNRSFIDFFGEQADTCVFIADTPGAVRADSALVPMLADFLAQSDVPKKFVVLHSYGSHFKYRGRYGDEHRVFTPDDRDAAARANRDHLINAYDNTIVATDAFIDDVIRALPDSILSAMFFVPDHGEDIFDDDRDRFLHASPEPTYWQIHVPMVLWTSAAHRSAFPSLTTAARNNADKDVASSRTVFDTMLSLAGVAMPAARPNRAVTDSTYHPEPRLYLNDYNESVPLARSGLEEEDLRLFRTKGISLQ